jgi:hypothetical protein
MKRVTVSLDESDMEFAKSYAAKHNAVARDQLEDRPGERGAVLALPVERQAQRLAAVLELPGILADDRFGDRDGLFDMKAVGRGGDIRRRRRRSLIRGAQEPSTIYR